ncbi:hypothetical protein CSKR_105787 [Clonorchis sinensis]|uniref:Uncharacterized protein n=1 Tax=Clonorchis sinensis TaxID=79923 RepID=A0A8T1M820_CLOSI|nr:hypothetical protein CSKR_105787 [Clonorchis sinensis]
MGAKMDPSVRPDLFAFTFIMFWLVVFQGTCHHWEKYRLRLEEVIYDCRGYFSNIEKEHARKVVHELVGESCPLHVNMDISLFTAYHEECKVEFSYHPYKDALLVHPQCSKAVNQILANLPELVWGSPWGCAAMNMSFELTDYYSVKVELPRLRLTYIHGEYDAQCESRILGITVNERISCRMNSFGGYEWENVNMSACSVPELNGADLERLHFLRASPMYCRLMIFMLYGYVKLQPVLLETHIHTVLDHIHYECAPFTPSDFEAVYNDFRNILDLVIHQLGNRPKPKLNDRFVIHAVTSLMRVFGRRLQDYFNTSTLFQQPTRVMYAFQTAAKNEIARVTCGWNYDIIIKRITGNVMVICLESIRALKDITAGGLAIFSGLVYTELLEPSPNMVLDIYFKLPIEFTSVDYICARYNPTAKTDGDLWDTRDSCFMKRRRGATIRCVCRHTGYYAILYPQKDFETVGVKFYGILRGHGMHLVHVVTSVLLLFGLSYLLAVRLVTPLRKAFFKFTHQKPVDAKGMLTLSIQLLTLQLAKVLLQMLVISIDQFHWCKVVGLLFNGVLVGHATMTLAASITVSCLPKFQDPWDAHLKVTLSVYMFMSAFLLGIYATGLDTYARVSCLPGIYTLLYTVPIIAISLVNLVVLSTFLFFGSFKHKDEWCALLLDVLFSLSIWMTMIHAEAPRTHMTVEFTRMTFLNAMHAVVTLACQCVLKPKMLFFSRHLILRLFGRK